MKCLAIGGEPATGKTTLMRSIYGEMNTRKMRFGLLSGHYDEEHNITLCGLYDQEGTFAGTDRLSMAVNADFLAYANIKNRNLMFEGDRLFSLKNLRQLTNQYQTRIIILTQTDEELHRRHEARGDTQTDKFLKGRKTKINNIISEMAGKIEQFTLNDTSETERLKQDLWEWITT